MKIIVSNPSLADFVDGCTQRIVQDLRVDVERRVDLGVLVPTRNCVRAVVI